MRRLILTLLTLGLCSGALWADTTHSKKTFLSPRAVGVNKAMEHSIWHHHLHTKWAYDPTEIKSHIQVTPFYQKSEDEDDIGRYFGIGNGKNEIKFSEDPTDPDMLADVLITHVMPGADASTQVGEKATIKFNPEQEIFGVRLDYFQCINRPLKGLFFKASTVIAHVENDMNLLVCDEDKTAYPNDGTFGMKDFFTGKINITKTLDDLTNPLTHAKIDKQSETGIADIDLALGYKWLHDKTKHVCINIGVTIPTGKKVRGEYLFEPFYGNGRHFALGGGIDAGVQLWKGNKGKIRLEGGINYKYLFEATETRMPGLKSEGVSGAHLAHYYQAGKLNQPVNTPLFPLANVLTQNVSVKPGSQIDALVALNFQSKCFVVDAGYNLYWRDEESVHLKCWDEKAQYVIADPEHNTSTQIFTGTPPATSISVKAPKFFPTGIKASDLDTCVAETPSQLTHKVFGGLAYKFKLSRKYPTSLGLGASYEFVDDNSALEQWAVWLKGGISF